MKHFVLKTLTDRRWLVAVAATLLVGWNPFGTPASAETRSYVSRIEATGQGYDRVVDQAEAAATRVINQAFAQNPALTQVSVTITGRRDGQEVPVLTTRVSRANWQRSPRAESWARYSGDSAKVLLGYEQPSGSQPIANGGVAPGVAQTGTVSGTVSGAAVGGVAPGATGVNPTVGSTAAPTGSPALFSPLPTSSPGVTPSAGTNLPVQSQPGSDRTVDRTPIQPINNGQGAAAGQGVTGTTGVGTTGTTGTTNTGFGTTGTVNNGAGTTTGGTTGTGVIQPGNLPVQSLPASDRGVDANVPVQPINSGTGTTQQAPGVPVQSTPSSPNRVDVAPIPGSNGTGAGTGTTGGATQPANAPVQSTPSSIRAIDQISPVPNGR